MLRRLLSLAFLAVGLWATPAGAAGLLPWGKVQYVDANGAPCVGCTVTFYIPSTTTPKDTWTDADETTLNTNPVVLDSLGTATIYGVGTYRQILKDATGVTLWDAITADPVSLNAGWGGLSTGSANAQAITVGNYSAADGQVVYWLAGFSNSGALTLNINATGAVNVVKDTSSGPTALGGGEVVVGNVVGAIYSTTTGQFHLITPVPVTSFDGSVFFNGYITPTILAADQDNWTPSGGFSSANTVRLSSNAAINITGLAGGASGRQVSFQNIGSFATTFVTNSTSSSAANRFLFSNSIVLNPNDSLTVQYDALSNGWREPSAPAPLYQPGFIYGCILSNNALDATNDIDITACSSRASSTIANINAIAMTKQLDADWAAGTNKGMRYSGAAITNTTYHVFEISNASGNGDYFAYTGVDPTAVLPSGYVNYRRIGSIVRTAGAIVAFIQNGNDFLWKSPPALSISNATPGTTANTGTLAVPVGITVRAKINAYFNVGGGCYFTALNQTDDAPATAGTPLYTLYDGANATGASFDVYTDTSAQMRYRCDANNPVRAAVVGWTDTRGQLAP